MIDTTVEGLHAFIQEKENRKKKLNELTSSSFKGDDVQMAALNHYVNDFELTVNEMYVYRFLGEGLKIWGGSWAVGFFLPLPELAKSFLSYCLYAGAFGMLLNKRSYTDFSDRVNEMKLLYNWCLKDGKTTHNKDIDNSARLENPILQKLVKLLAPCCEINEMIAWTPDDSLKNNHSSGWTQTIAAGSAAVSHLYFLFSKADEDSSKNKSISKDTKTTPKTGMELFRSVSDLKRAVETGELKMGVYKGFEQAIRYTTSPEFRALMTTEIVSRIDQLKSVVQPAIMSSVGNSFKRD